jgi:uncharacterized protein (TIRG00374 family)
MRRKLLYFIGLAALIAASYLVIRRDFDRQLFMESFWNIRPVWIAATVLVTFLSYVLRAVRWRRLLIPLKSVGLASLVTGTILGFAAIYALGRAGEVVRPLWVARQENIPVTGSFASIVVERVFDTLMIVLLFAIGLGTTSVPGPAANAVALLSRAAWLMLFGSVAAMAFLAFSHRNVGRIKAWIPFRSIRSIFETFTSGAGPLADPKTMATIAGHSILVWIVVALQFWLMLLALNLDLPPGTVALVLGVSALGSVAQLPGVGGGFQAAFVFSTTAFAGVPTETAVAAALLAWLITYIPTLLVGALYMMWRGISTKDLVRGQDTDPNPA